MRFSCITVGYRSRADDAVPEIIAGPEVPYAEQEAAVDAAAREDEGGDYVRVEIWYRNAAPRSVEFSTAAEKAQRAAALDSAAAEAAAADRAKASQREALLKQAEALGFDRKAPEAEAAKAKADAEAARAEADAAKAELESLKAALTQAAESAKLPETNPPQATPEAGELAHNQPLAGSTPAPATTPTPTPPPTDGAESTSGNAPEPPANSAPSPPPVSGKKKSS